MTTTHGKNGDFKLAKCILGCSLAGRMEVRRPNKRWKDN
jgi:hypothetical protein